MVVIRVNDVNLHLFKFHLCVIFYCNNYNVRPWVMTLFQYLCLVFRFCLFCISFLFPKFVAHLQISGWFAKLFPSGWISGIIKQTTETWNLEAKEYQQLLNELWGQWSDGVTRLVERRTPRCYDTSLKSVRSTR